MRMSYKKLWIMLVEKEISQATLRKDLNIATGTMTNATFTYDEEKQTGRFFGHAEESVKIADKAMRNLKYENNIRERVLNIIEDHDRHLSQKPNKIKVEIFNKGPERYFDMINFKRADDSAKNPNKKDMYGDYDKIENIAKEYLKGNPILSHKDLAIKPKDIVIYMKEEYNKDIDFDYEMFGDYYEFFAK